MPTSQIIRAEACSSPASRDIVVRRNNRVPLCGADAKAQVQQLGLVRVGFQPFDQQPEHHHKRGQAAVVDRQCIQPKGGAGRDANHMMAGQTGGNRGGFGVGIGIHRAS